MHLIIITMPPGVKIERILIEIAFTSVRWISTSIIIVPCNIGIAQAVAVVIGFHGFHGSKTAQGSFVFVQQWFKFMATD